jgi:hypothetical protein
MSDADHTDADHTDAAGDELSPALLALLADSATWEEPPDLGQQIVDEIRAERAAAPASIDAQRQRRSSRVIPRWLAVAAGIAAIVAAGAVLARLGDTGGDELSGVAASLTGTELAPGASATAELTNAPAGLKIVLDVEGLPGAGPNEMYEAWVTDGTIRVSAGTFHLRRGDEPIALWAGVADPRFHTITVTLEPVDGVAESSGQVVLRGEYSLGG